MKISDRLMVIETDIKWIKKMLYAVIAGVITNLGLENKELIIMFFGVVI